MKRAVIDECVGRTWVGAQRRETHLAYHISGVYRYRIKKPPILIIRIGGAYFIINTKIREKLPVRCRSIC